MTEPIHWVYLTTAPDQLTAEMWKELLSSNGFTVMVRAGDTASYLGVFAGPTRILVDQSNLEDASQFIQENLDSEALR
ncbi:MAG: putative signal transducing protein [Chloroflexi bacterium]|jgi:hypothetical protein|nr:MAG: putative signal transducing protein [Chloroflexota bacterium]